MYILNILLIMLILYKWFEQITLFMIQKCIETYTWNIQPYLKTHEIEWEGPEYPIFVKFYGFTSIDGPEDLTDTVNAANEKLTLEEILDGNVEEVLNNLFFEKENPFLMVNDTINWKWCEIHYTYRNKMFRIIFEDTVSWPPQLDGMPDSEKIIVADIENESILDNIKMYEGPLRDFHGNKPDWKKMIWDTKWYNSKSLDITIISNFGVIQTYSLDDEMYLKKKDLD